MNFDADFALVLGLVLGAFSLPAILSAFNDGRAPRVAMIVIMIAGGCIVYALRHQPGGYDVGDIPHVFANVVERYTR